MTTSVDFEAPMSDERREEIRARALAALPSWYVPWLHLFATAGIGVVVTIVSVLRIHALQPWQLAVVPLVFIFSNGVEWRAHRNVLHRRWKPLGILYDRHTPMHHMVFQYHSMNLRSAREFGLVLIPAAGVFAVVLVLAPFAYGVSRLLGSNAGWLVLTTGSLYVVLYELSHLAYHLPPESFVGRRRLVRVLREHHARHHDPRLMQKWNFNVTLPLFDWLHGTIARGDVLAKIGITPTTVANDRAGSRDSVNERGTPARP